MYSIRKELEDVMKSLRDVVRKGRRDRDISEVEDWEFRPGIADGSAVSRSLELERCGAE